MNNFYFPPGIIGILGAFIIILTPRKFIKILGLFISILILYNSFNLNLIQPLYYSYAGIKLNLFTHQNPYSYIFAIAFSLALFIGVLFNYGLGNVTKLEIAASIFYAGSTISLATSGDLISYFIFNELMAVSAAVIIFSNRNAESRNAGKLYLATHFLGGTLLLASISYIYFENDNIDFIKYRFESMNFSDFSLSNLSAIMFLISILINSATPPFSGWLVKGYPSASPSSIVYLSAFTTKAAIFSLISFFPSNSILIYIGLGMILYGIIYAILENNIHKVLSYSIINQVGFMITAIGIGTDLAIAGAALHAFCHIFYKLLLMMTASSVVYITGTAKSSELGGLYKSMKYTCFFAIIGSAAISAFPFTSGYISKSLISFSAKDSELYFVWIALMIASAGVFLHAGIKFPWFVFFAKKTNSLSTEKKIHDPSKLALFAMFLASIICILPGLYPKIIYQLLPLDITEFQPNNIKNITHQMEILLSSALAFFLLLPLLKRTNTITLDFDELNNYFLKRTKKSIMVVAVFIDNSIPNLYAFSNIHIKNFGNFKIFNKTKILPVTIITSLAYILICIIWKLIPS